MKIATRLALGVGIVLALLLAVSITGYNALSAYNDEVEIVLQINGKVRGRIMLPAGADRAAMEQAAKENARVQELTAGKTIVKVICVPKKLVNIVVKG